MNVCIIGTGSNIYPDENISRVLDILSENARVIKVSNFVKTRPIGIEDQPWFTNGAVKVETEMEMEDFRYYLKTLEDRLGRDRSQPEYGSRNIDLDIVVWNGAIVDDDYYTRDFLKNAVDSIND